MSVVLLSRVLAVDSCSPVVSSVSRVCVVAIAAVDGHHRAVRR